ncbi:hypothetical protein [Sandaracinus amylolyticus]|uniref:Uncharacterized protein n=1 Tax=Sandaracinus amylolyticus TaxID=927083 RepID=A0A0F6YN72_9BACT|nr:hypothetical protein [Sandaracinus amylolyticus]AKF10978.1 hypothetical protein DB32_008127 [Sandaracinus amylolyticus]
MSADGTSSPPATPADPRDEIAVLLARLRAEHHIEDARDARRVRVASLLGELFLSFGWWMWP